MKIKASAFEHVCEDGFVASGYIFDKESPLNVGATDIDLATVRAMRLLTGPDTCHLSIDHIVFNEVNGRKHCIMDENGMPVIETKQYKVKSFTVEFEPIEDNVTIKTV
jgi:hypothetical protein